MLLLEATKLKMETFTHALPGLKIVILQLLKPLPLAQDYPYALFVPPIRIVFQNQIALLLAPAETLLQLLVKVMLVVLSLGRLIPSLGTQNLVPQQNCSNTWRLESTMITIAVSITARPATHVQLTLRLYALV
jgi:hypothetical protein